MDDAQVQSWRDGDAMAAAAVRNGLRAIADAVLAAPLGTAGSERPTTLARDPDARREASAAVAREVMQRGGASAADLRALAVMVAARHVVSSERDHRAEGGEGHLPPQLVVSLALAPDSLTGHAKTIAERHIGECVGCRGDVDLVRFVVKRVTLPRPVAPAAREAAGDEGSAPREAAAAPASPPTPASPPAPAKAPARPPAARKPRTRRMDPPDTVPWWRAAWPLAAILVVLGALYLVRNGGSRAATDVAAVQALASRQPDALPAAADLPEDVDSAALDLERGECRLAADRFGRGRQRHPDDPALAWWQGVALVCAGDGDGAFAALDAYLQQGGASSGELLWLQAQALLLQGDAIAAQQRLVSARPLVGAARGQQVDQQLDALMALSR